MSDEEYQIQRFKKIVSVGLKADTGIEKVGEHFSKSRLLPIVRASNHNSNVNIERLADNFYFNFLGVTLKEPVLATLLYPISAMFQSYPPSGNTDESFPPITNFEKAYHNREGIQKFGAVASHDITTAMAIRYLHEVSSLNAENLMDIVMDNTRHGKKDVIDHNGIDYVKLARELKIKNADKKEITYFAFNAGNLPPSFKRINVDWISIDLGGSSLRIELAEGGIPPLTLPLREALFVPTTEKQRETGLGKEIPVACLEDHVKRKEALNGTQFTLKTPNPLDVALTFFYLTKVVAPVMEAFKEER